MTRSSGFLWVGLALGVSFVALAHDRTISEGTARNLVRQALVTLGENPLSFEIEHWAYQWSPRFYTFAAYRGSTASTDIKILATHYFAVNPWTGDVWEAMGCTRITSPAIQKEQELIRKRSGLPAAAWENLRAKKSLDSCPTAVGGASTVGDKGTGHETPK